jgi:hypothetical protein
MDALIYSLVAFVGLFIYFLPALIAGKKRNATAILWLNILLGWTFLGWVGALIWALKNDPEPPAAPYYGFTQDDLDEQEDTSQQLQEDIRIKRLKRLRDEGVITQEEFMQQLGAQHR